MTMESGKFQNNMSDFLIDQINLEDFNWKNLALCREAETNFFFENYENNKNVARQIDSMCLACPVQKECYERGVSNKETGVWGGFYLINGVVDKNKNSHKTREVVDIMLEKIFHEDI